MRGQGPAKVAHSAAARDKGRNGAKQGRRMAAEESSVVDRHRGSVGLYTRMMGQCRLHGPGGGTPQAQERGGRGEGLRG